MKHKHAELIDAAEMALDALERGTTGLAIRAIPALRQALAQSEQEPVAYKYTDKTNPLVFYFTERKGKDVTQNPDVIETALYTAPPKREWVGLTDDECDEIWGNCLGIWDCLKMTEAKLKEKNGG